MRHLAVLLALACLGGCRFKGAESFQTATTPNPPLGEPETRVQDPYSFSSNAEASGGLNPKNSYSIGEPEIGRGPIDPHLNRPAKGSGQQPGELTSAAMPGYGQSNAPAAQPLAGSAASQSVKSGR